MALKTLGVPRPGPALLRAFALCVGGALGLLGQVTGTISGYVRDQSGGVIVGATVTATQPDQQITRSAQTDETGFYNLLAMPRGTYTLASAMTGFSTRVQNEVELTAGANARVDFELSVGNVGERVTVEATAPMVETRDATQSSLIDDRRVQDLPLNGRNVIGLANTMANVTNVNASQDMSDNRAGPTMSVNGSNINQNLFTFNGAIFTNFDQTTGFNPPPPDAIQEIRIQTHNFSAEYGYTAGGQVSIVSKAGTNEFHGSAWEFLRNDRLNARSFFQPRRPAQRQNQLGAAAGGPIVKNKSTLR